MLTEVDSLKAIASRRFIFARWFFLFAGILLAGYQSSVGSALSITTDPVLGAVVGVLFGVAILNLFFLFFFNIANHRSSHFLFVILNSSQLLVDLVLVLFILALFPTGSPLIGLLLIWPVSEAILLFDSTFALVVALVGGGGLLVLARVPAMDLSLFSGLFNLPVFGLSPDIKSNSLYISGIVLLFVVFWSFFTDLIRIRQINRGLSTKLESASPRPADLRPAQAEWARGFGRKMEENARLLRSKQIELTLAKEQLDTLENAKSEFISVTTHELRTPLSAIKWTFNMIMSEQLGPINAEQKEFLDKGYQSALKMISIVNNLVHIDHATAKPEDYNFTAVDVSTLIESVMTEFTNQVTSKKINLTFHKTPTALPPLTIDQDKIRMTLENLIDNAIKYTPKGGSITVGLTDNRLNSAQPAVEISVRDSGVGIPKEEQDKIFHKFFRASNARLAEPDGSGIGLYIAKDVVDRHHGSMWFESEENKGTTFHIVLPVRQPTKAVV